MRFIGNKEGLVDTIQTTLAEKGIEGQTFFDLFSGTTSVARLFKKRGYAVQSSDLLYFSYCLQKAYIENSKEPTYERLLPEIDKQLIPTLLFASPLDRVVDFLNTLAPVEGFIYDNYTPSGTQQLEQPRMFFSDENGKKIDAVRQQIEAWKEQQKITESEYYILLACLIESVPFFANISGVYAAFLKTWDPRAVKPFILRPVEVVAGRTGRALLGDSTQLCGQIDVDILYLDPPYNQRQYAPNYHLLETIARYDNPKVSGVVGLRDYKDQKSQFCNAKTALEALDYIAQHARYKHLVLSYNSEGIMPSDRIVATLEQYGKVVKQEFEYLRFKSNNNGDSKTKKHIFEQLYILTPYEC